MKQLVFRPFARTGSGSTTRPRGNNPKDRMSALGHKLFDHLVGAEDKRLWKREAERLSGFKIKNQLELCWLLDRKDQGFAPFSILSV
jgi:hypothetical protein